MAYNFSQFRQKTKDLEDWLKREMATIRTGRATPAILDGVKVFAYDPLAMENAQKKLDTVNFSKSYKECIHSSDVVIITTAWKEFKNLEPSDFNQGNKKTVIDCWNIFPDSCKGLVNYISLGTYHKS